MAARQPGGARTDSLRRASACRATGSRRRWIRGSAKSSPAASPRASHRQKGQGDAEVEVGGAPPGGGASGRAPRRRGQGGGSRRRVGPADGRSGTPRTERRWGGPAAGRRGRSAAPGEAEVGRRGRLRVRRQPLAAPGPQGSRRRQCPGRCRRPGRRSRSPAGGRTRGSWRLPRSATGTEKTTTSQRSSTEARSRDQIQASPSGSTARAAGERA